jgi:DinB family protein
VTGTSGTVVPSWLPFDYVYQRLRNRLEGLTDNELRWEPAPAVTTIAWRLAHIADTLREERNWRWMEREPTLRDADTEQPGTAVAALAYLDASYAACDGLLRSLQPEELWRPVGAVAGPFEGEPVVALVVHILDELVHHAAEVALLRDLYAAEFQSRS